MFGLMQRLFGRKGESRNVPFDDVVTIPQVKREARRPAGVSTSPSPRRRDDDDDFATPYAVMASVLDATPAATYSTGGHTHTHSDPGSYGDTSYGGDAGI